MLDIKVTLSQNLKQKPADESALGFGRIFTDHMFLMAYEKGIGWSNARIVPYGNFAMGPAAMVLHYGQAIFEGSKCYRRADGGLQLFRPQDNLARMSRSAERMGMPALDEESALEGLKQLIKIEEAWVPHKEGTSLYIRPFIIATDPQLGVHPSHTYIFAIILSPVGSYYAAGINPVKIYVEREYVRCVKGGTGRAKAGGNYAASLIGQKRAEDMGYAQVLWLDGIYRKYIDEVGAMNVFFVINGTVVTPSLEDGNILPGVTRASCVELLQKWGIPVEERKLSIDEVIAANENGTLDEAFGTGTAAVISPIGELFDEGKHMIINNNEIGPIAQKLYDAITGMQWGKKPDEMGWIEKID